MTEGESGPVLYEERGSSWWPVLWGPAFAVVAFAVEALTPGGVHIAFWALIGGCLAVAAAVWVYGRRKVCTVLLTPTALHAGRETLPVERIAAVTDVGVPVGARVLGGSWAVPRGTGEVPLRLTADRTDESPVVLAWSRDPVALAQALRALVEKE